MTEPRRALVDTNILVDVTNATGEWLAWSRGKVADFYGGLYINPIIYSELCVPLESSEDAEAMMVSLGLVYLELSRESLFLAAKVFRQYRRQGGTKTTPLPDFSLVHMRWCSAFQFSPGMSAATARISPRCS